MLATTFIARGVESLRSPKPAADAAKPTLEGLAKLPDPVGPNVPTNAETVAKVTAGVQVGAGLLLATGKLPRLASAALAFSVVPGSLGAHAFWNESDPERMASERRAFLADLSLIGGLIIASVDTEGRPSLGWRGRRAAKKVSASVSGVLPSSSNGALVDSELVDRVGHNLQSGLHVARERGAELADVASKRGAELADVASKRGAEFADVATKRSTEIAEVASKRGEKLAAKAQKRSDKLAVKAQKRGPELATLARERSVELAERARDRSALIAELAADRSAEIAENARQQAKQAKKQAKKQRRS